VLELGPAGRGEPVPLGGPPPSRLLPGRRGRGLGVTRLDQRVEVPAHTGGRQTQPVADLTGRDRPGLDQQPHDGAAGLPVRNRDSRYRRDRDRRGFDPGKRPSAHLGTFGVR